MASRRNVILFALLFASTAFADLRPSDAWQDAAAKAGLAKGDIQRLARDKVLMTNRTWKQVFSAYIGTQTPVFITSDSLLNAFHVLFEESVLRMIRKMTRG